MGEPGALFPLSEVGSTVGASSLPQGETADEPKGEQDDGQEDAQEGERVLQDPDPAETRGRAVRVPLQRNTRGRRPSTWPRALSQQQMLVPINTYIAKNTKPKSLESFRLTFPCPRGKFKKSDSLDCVWLLLVGGRGSRFQQKVEITQVHTVSLTLGGLISKLLLGKKSH